jgi:hypothetical protein
VFDPHSPQQRRGQKCVVRVYRRIAGLTGRFMLQQVQKPCVSTSPNHAHNLQHNNVVLTLSCNIRLHGSSELTPCHAAMARLNAKTEGERLPHVLLAGLLALLRAAMCGRCAAAHNSAAVADRRERAIRCSAARSPRQPQRPMHASLLQLHARRRPQAGVLRVRFFWIRPGACRRAGRGGAHATRAARWFSSSCSSSSSSRTSMPQQSV